MPANQVVCYYVVGGFCRQSQQVEVENCENHSSDEIGGAASDYDSIPHDSETVSDSQSIPDEICGAASDSESIQDDIGAAESESDSIQHNMDISDTEIMQESDTDSNNCQRSRVHCQHHSHDQEK